MTLGRLIARSTIGALFVGHGTQKLFGWFGGPGLEGTGQMMDTLELRPPRRHALAASLAETIGGALLVLGAATPVAAAPLNGSMFTAVRKVHFDKGPWNTQGGYEYNVVLVAATTALVETGPGRPLGRRRALARRRLGTRRPRRRSRRVRGGDRAGQAGRARARAAPVRARAGGGAGAGSSRPHNELITWAGPRR